MAFEALINSNLNRAFNLAKDLAVDVQFVRKTGDGFDFATATSNLTNSSSITVKAIITDTEKSSKERNVSKKLVMLKTQEVGDVNSYDSINYQNINWKLGPIIKSTQFITVVEMYKEA